MRVLHLYSNVASQMAATVRGLRALGIDAHGLIWNSSQLTSSEGLQILAQQRNSDRFRRYSRIARLTCFSLREIFRADVIHWYFAETLPFDLDLRFAKLIRRPGVAEFLGSEIRVPEEEQKVNPYYASLGDDYEYRAVESKEQSFKRQKKFADRGFGNCLIHASFSHYLRPSTWRRVYISRARIMTADFVPCFPDPNRKRPIIAHSPTVRVGKGTPAVRRAISKLKDRFDFEYREIIGMPHEKALKAMQECDIFLDQFVDGGSYGVAAVEAFAMGKPVICFIRPQAVPLLPDGCPLINANQDNLSDVIVPLMQNGELRQEIGRQGRRFAEEYHDAVVYAQWLAGVYREVMEEKGRNA